MMERRHFIAACIPGGGAVVKVLFLLLCAVGSFWARAQNPTVSQYQVSSSTPGSDYVQMTQWAQANKFRLQWVETNKRLRATNANARIIFDIDSRRAEVNGINFFLSFPIIGRNGTVYISVTDLKHTLHPVLFPEKNPTNTFIKTICLDPGHGGRDPGKLDGHKEEKRYTLLLAAELERLLLQSGFRVVSTRQREDQTVELDERAKIANRNNADLFVSLHYNAAANRNVQGAEIYCLAPAGTSSSNNGINTSPAAPYPAHDYNNRNVLLAYQVQKSLVKNLKVEDRGVKRSQFMVLLNPKCPAILIEAGFMSHSGEAQRIYDNDYRKRMALAIHDGILAYKKIVER